MKLRRFIVLLGLVLVAIVMIAITDPQHVHGTSWALHQHTGASVFSNVNPATTYSGSVASGALLIAGLGWYGSGVTFTCADSVNAGNWASITLQTSGGSGYGQIFYLTNSAAGTPTVTCTKSGTISGADLTIYEYRGGAVGTIDGNNGAGSTGTTSLSTGNITTTGTADLCVEVAVAQGHAPAQSNSGYTTEYSYVNSQYVMEADNGSVNASTFALTATATSTAMTNSGACFLSQSGAASGAGRTGGPSLAGGPTQAE